VLTCTMTMSPHDEWQRFVGKVSATLELTCFDCECSSVTDLVQIQPTWTSPLIIKASPQDPPPGRTGCAWHHDASSTISSTKVSDHIQHLLSRFVPIKSRLEEMRPPPWIKVSLYWACSPFGVTGEVGPEFTPKDVKGMAELGARLQVKVIVKNEIREG
jgi:hypothetical protein